MVISLIFPPPPAYGETPKHFPDEIFLWVRLLPRFSHFSAIRSKRLWLGYLCFKAKQFARTTPFEVNIHPYVGVDLSDLVENMSYKPIDICEPAKDLPLKWFQCHPCIGSKILCWHLEPEGESILHLVITGNTWLYRDDLERHFWLWF